MSFVHEPDLVVQLPPRGSVPRMARQRNVTQIPQVTIDARSRCVGEIAVRELLHNTFVDFIGHGAEDPLWQW